MRTVRVGLLGFGRIGQAVAALADRERDRLTACGVDLRIAAALVRDVRKPRSGPSVALSTFASAVLGRDIDVVVEVMGGIEPARTFVASALGRGIPVVTANKTLIASHGNDLRALAARRETTLALDAAVLAGVPFVGSLARRPLIAASSRIAGIINGTSHFIVCALERGASFERALAEARARGYAEPDASADTTGRDAAEKLTILLHLAGCVEARVADLPCTGLDVLEPQDLAAARILGGTIKPVAAASLAPGAAGAWVGPTFVESAHPFSSFSGVTNVLQLTSARGQDVLFAGPGAGPDATAATIVDDLVETVGRRQPKAFAGFGGGRAAVPAASLRAPADGPWFVRISSVPELDAVRSAALLAGRNVRVSRIVVSGDRIVALTATTSWPAIRSASAVLEAHGARVLALPVVR